MQPHRNNNVALIRQIDHHSQRKSEADHANEMLMQGRKSGGGGGACAI